MCFFFTEKFSSHLFFYIFIAPYVVFSAVIEPLRCPLPRCGFVCFPSYIELFSASHIHRKPFRRYKVAAVDHALRLFACYSLIFASPVVNFFFESLTTAQLQVFIRIQKLGLPYQPVGVSHVTTPRTGFPKTKQKFDVVV